MRSKIAGAIFGLAGLVGSTVVTMMWPTIDHRLGVGILYACAAAVAVALLIWLPIGLEYVLGARPTPVWRLMWSASRDRMGLTFHFGDWFPFRQLIPLHRATVKAHSAAKKTAVFRLLDNLDNKNPKKIPGTIAQMLLDGRSAFDFPLYGICPPSEEFERIPKEDAERLLFSDDAKSLIDPF